MCDYSLSFFGFLKICDYSHKPMNCQIRIMYQSKILIFIEKCYGRKSTVDYRHNWIRIMYLQSQIVFLNLKKSCDYSHKKLDLQ